MKNVLFILTLVLTFEIAYSQDLIIHTKDGLATPYQIALIDSITFSLQSPQPDTRGLVAWYPFNSNFNDSTGNGYNGTNQNTTFIPDRFSTTNKALHFTGGSSSFVTTSNTGGIALNDSFSVCFWLKFENAGIVIEKDIPGNYSTDWNIYCDQTGKLGFQFGSLTRLFSNGNINDNNWHLIVFLRNRSSGVLKIYIDGILDRQFDNQTNNLTGTANINIGAWENPTFNDGFTGSLDDVRFYLRELSESEIQQLYLGTM